MLCRDIKNGLDGGETEKMSRHQKMTYSNVTTSEQVCTSKGMSQLCRDITTVSQHQLNVMIKERQCHDIRINL